MNISRLRQLCSSVSRPYSPRYAEVIAAFAIGPAAAPRLLLPSRYAARLVWSTSTSSGVCDSAVDFVGQPPQIGVHDRHERAELVDDRGFRHEIAVEVIKGLAGFLRHVLERQPEPLRVAEHRLVRRVDELAAALGDLAREKAAQRPAAAAGADAGVVDGGDDAAFRERVSAREPGEAGADDADIRRGAWTCGAQPFDRRRD